MATIRCHTVSEFYLKYFLQPRLNLFWVYDKKDVDVRPQSPINTTVIGDYYLSEPDASGKKDKRVEEFFSFIEDQTKPILDRLVEHPDSFSELDKNVLATFIAFTYCRSPRAVQAMKEMNEASVDYVLDQVKEIAQDSIEMRSLYEKFSQKENNDTNLSYDEFIQVMKDPNNGVYVEVNEKHAIGESLLLAEVIHRWIMRLYWHIRITTKGHFFITSDAPVTIFTPLPNTNNQVIFGGGLGLPTAQLTFPLSPRVCLHMDRNPLDQIGRVDASYVNKINLRSVYMSERFIISPFRSNRIKRMVEEGSSTFKIPKINANVFKDNLKKKGLDFKDSLREGFKEKSESSECDVNF